MIACDNTDVEIFFSGRKMAHLWSKFEQFHLSENMRLIGRGPEETEFARYLMRIGNGTENEDIDSAESAEVEIPIPHQLKSTAKSISDFCEEIYPNLKDIVSRGLEENDSNWHQWLVERAIICPTNSNVEDINSTIIKSFPGKMQTYMSYDVCLTKEQVKFHIDILNIYKHFYFRVTNIVNIFSETQLYH